MFIVQRRIRPSRIEWGRPKFTLFSRLTENSGIFFCDKKLGDKKASPDQGIYNKQSRQENFILKKNGDNFFALIFWNVTPLVFKIYTFLNTVPTFQKVREKKSSLFNSLSSNFFLSFSVNFLHRMSTRDGTTVPGMAGQGNVTDSNCGEIRVAEIEIPELISSSHLASK